MHCTCCCAESGVSCNSSVLEGVILSTLCNRLWKCWESEWQNRERAFSCFHYEYVSYQCLVSLLILWFWVVEELWELDFLTHQFVRKKTCLIFTCVEIFDSWSWTKRIYCGLMFHWAREKPQILSPLWVLPLRLCEVSLRFSDCFEQIFFFH